MKILQTLRQFNIAITLKSSLYFFITSLNQLVMHLAHSMNNESRKSLAVSDWNLFPICTYVEVCGPSG